MPTRGTDLEPTWQDKCLETGEMSPITKLWLATVRRWWNKTAVARLRQSSRIVSMIEAGFHPGESPEAGLGPGRRVAEASPCRRLSTDVGLAADHVESIRALLEISQAHQQPIPRAVFQNLDLVSKHLRAIQRRLEAGRPDGSWDSGLVRGKVLQPVRSLLVLAFSRSPSNAVLLHPIDESFAANVEVFRRVSLVAAELLQGSHNELLLD